MSSTVKWPLWPRTAATTSPRGGGAAGGGAGVLDGDAEAREAAIEAQLSQVDGVEAQAVPGGEGASTERLVVAQDPELVGLALGQRREVGAHQPTGPAPAAPVVDAAGVL